MKITAHCLVRNEENFVWYAINSVLPYVEKMFVWDTGSTDKTAQIISLIKSPKIVFEERGGVDPYGFASLRQEMVEKTKTDWIMILDGDEVWWDGALKEVTRKLQNRQSYDLVVSPCYMAIGDIFHYQEEEAGKYQIHGRKGHLNIRFIKNFPGLKVHGFYGNEGFSNNFGRKIENFPKEKILFSEAKYLHLSHLERSGKSKNKFKYELGEIFPRDFYYPEVFFREKPSVVPSPWKVKTKSYKLLALVETPLKKIKRRII